MNDIRSLRKSRGLTLQKLAASSGVSRKELSKCERGLCVPDAEFFQSVARILNVHSADLLSEHERLATDSTVAGEGYVTRTPAETFLIKPRKPPRSKLIPVLDLFCGSGGFSHGFEQSGQYQVVYGLDLLPDRIQTFSKNHEYALAHCSDIRDISDKNLARICPAPPEIVIAGPPCQGFSSIRPFRTLTENDARNNLYEYCATVIARLKPRWFVIENVVGLMTNNKGKTLAAVLSLLESVGYTVTWKVLNSAFYGLPQRRERLIVVGNRSGSPFEWPSPTHYLDSRSMAGNKHGQKVEQDSLFGQRLLPAVNIMEAIHDLPELASGEKSSCYRDDIDPTDYERRMRGNVQTLTLHEATKHSARMLEIIRQAGNNRSSLPPGLTNSGFSSSYSRLEPDLPSVTLTVNFVHPSSNKCIHPYQDRALTPREGSRIQGFEDSFEFVGTRSQIVKQIGNAVPPLFGKLIGEALLRQS